MNNSIRYPKIMEHGEHSSLNAEILGKLGTPIFFSTPEPSRPRVNNPTGMLYEIVTGLYIIYHDHGIKLLDTYCKFCETQGYSWVNPAKRHIKLIYTLRTGFCHGGFDKGNNAHKFVNEIKRTLGLSSTEEWPSFSNKLNDLQCQQIIDKLVDDSDKFVRHILFWASEIQRKPHVLEAWRQELRKKALNKDEKQYANGTWYFDPRLVQDIEDFVKPTYTRIPCQSTLHMWLVDMESKILNGEFQSTNELSESLYQALDKLYNPAKNIATQDSASIVDFSDFDDI